MTGRRTCNGSHRIPTESTDRAPTEPADQYQLIFLRTASINTEHDRHKATEGEFDADHHQQIDGARLEATSKRDTGSVSLGLIEFEGEANRCCLVDILARHELTRLAEAVWVKSVREELEHPPPNPPSLATIQLPTSPAHARTFAFTTPPRIRLSNPKNCRQDHPNYSAQTMLSIHSAQITLQTRP